VEFKNFTDLTEASEFILDELTSYDTSRLRLHLKFHRRSDQPVSGYFRFRDFQIVAAVRQKQRFPLRNAWPVGSRSVPYGRGWAWVWDEQAVCDRDALMVWIAGHELYHFLRHTHQIEGIQRETRANRFAFTWQRKLLALRAMPLRQMSRPA
jgi:hypothetical protein